MQLNNDCSQTFACIKEYKKWRVFSENRQKKITSSSGAGCSGDLTRNFSGNFGYVFVRTAFEPC